MLRPYKTAALYKPIERGSLSLFEEHVLQCLYLPFLRRFVVTAEGSSAYQVAVANGFVGTEAEWLASLQGADPDPNTVIANQHATLESAYINVESDDGTFSTGSYTPSLTTGGQVKSIKAAGLFTIEPPSLPVNATSATVEIWIENVAGASDLVDVNVGLMTAGSAVFDDVVGSVFFLTLKVRRTAAGAIQSIGHMVKYA